MSRAIAKNDRIPLDAYYTPDDVARSCVAVLGDLRVARCWEPHAGGGAFVRALMAGGAFVFASDIDPSATGLTMHRIGGSAVFDFLNVSDWLENVGWIVGNPPFTDAEAHVRHAIEDCRPLVGVAFLLRLAFLESEKRIPFWKAHSASEIHVLSRRPSFTGGGTDSAAYGFFVWRVGYQGPTILQHLETR